MERSSDLNIENIEKDGSIAKLKEKAQETSTFVSKFLFERILILNKNTYLNPISTLCRFHLNYLTQSKTDGFVTQRCPQQKLESSVVLVMLPKFHQLNRKEKAKIETQMLMHPG
eukprot:TRINITY_DN13293_c0_g1_i1.p1 TRINITY_DN13293_c0_g1~~TRINITY_DN13293_c0_g1_i1.p1  ORF type:complete len:114 (-),score=12.49 TRINITY_DN13293_c0_g1_i1:352-693(-)